MISHILILPALSPHPIFLITADWLVVDKSRDSQTITTMTEEAAHNHHVVSKCLDPEVSFSSWKEESRKNSTTWAAIAFAYF